MVSINATKFMVAFYEDHPYSIGSFVEAMFPDDPALGHRPFTREETILEGMALVFPALKPLILPLHSIRRGAHESAVPFTKARYGRFRKFRDVRGENPATTLLAIDVFQDISADISVWEWKEKRFPTIKWQYWLEIEPGKVAGQGREPLARYELIVYQLYEPGWETTHSGYVRFDAATRKPVEVSEVPVALTQYRSSQAPV